MKTNRTWKTLLLAAGLTLATSTLVPASAQTQRGDADKPVVPTYEGAPDAQYPVAPATTDPANSNQTRRGDSQKPVLPTYDSVPPAQSTIERDVSTLEENRGDSQKPVVPTYDKKPDPSGDAQKLDAVRYQEQNEANDGRGSELEMNVVEGEVD